MQFLIKSDEIIVDKIKRRPLPDFIRIQIIKDVAVDPYEKIPDKYIEPPIDPVIEDWENDNIDRLISLTSSGSKILLPTGKEFLTSSFNSGLLVIVESHPVYPQSAISRNIEGYVIVEFTVTESGSTDNIRVVKAMPDSIVNKSALRAISKSSYKPKIEDGKAVAVPGVLRKFTFELED